MIRTALKESARSTENYKHGAVITRGGAVLSKGRNSYRTHPTFGSGFSKSLHAEAAAIRTAVNAGINLRGATIYVARHGHKMSKPCPGCKAMIKEFGISKVVYTGNNGEIITEWPLCE